MADYYIRSWDPASTYPPNPQEGDVCYTITLDQSWAPVAGVKNDNLLKTEIYTSGNWVEQGGGGGGGDFKTVNVTLHTSNDGEVIIYAPYDDDNQGHKYGFFDLGSFISGGLSTLDGEDGTVTGKLNMIGDSVACYFYGDYVSSNGSVVHDEENYQLIISGNCEVTLANND